MILKRDNRIGKLRVIERYECSPSMEEVVVSVAGEDIQKGRTELVLEHKKDNKEKIE
ncbi:MAG: hypothetical protein HY776_02990 [Actinobacteria bacterium]|nr:hypothetical protein [Actinomycetota bacterium]